MNDSWMMGTGSYFAVRKNWDKERLATLIRYGIFCMILVETNVVLRSEK